MAGFLELTSAQGRGVGALYQYDLHREANVGMLTRDNGGRRTWSDSTTWYITDEDLPSVQLPEEDGQSADSQAGHGMESSLSETQEPKYQYPTSI